MHSQSVDALSSGARPQVVLDGLPVSLPRERRTLAGIRSYLETMALERQRILYSLQVDGKPASLAETLTTREPFARVDAESVDPDQMPLELVRTALTQTLQAQERVLAAVSLVMNSGPEAKSESWWNLSQVLKQPLLTAGLLIEKLRDCEYGGASVKQLYKWQLQQLGVIMKDVDKSCWSTDPTNLSRALQERVLPWLESLRRSLDLWYETLRT